ADDRPHEDEEELPRPHVLENSEVIDDARPDEDLEDGEQASLLLEVRLAGLVNDVRDLQHALVRRELLHLAEHEPSEEAAQEADREPDVEERQARDRGAEERVAGVDLG